MIARTFRTVCLMTLVTLAFLPVPFQGIGKANPSKILIEKQVQSNHGLVSIEAVLQTATGIATGGSHTCALTSAGGVMCWGSNAYGQLGDGTLTDRLIPVDVSGLASGVTAISAGENHTCALVGGGIKCWGSNSNGKLGDGTTSNHTIPVDVINLGDTAIAVSAGGEHTCAVTSGGAAKCWGSNDFGQLGDKTKTSSTTPVNVDGLGSGVSAISAGGYHTCAIAGGVKCWGSNHYFQLGDNSNTDRTSPVDVYGLGSGATSISTRYWHTCVLMYDGAVKCWGYNGDGELGDGTYSSRNTPVDVVSLAGPARGVSAGSFHTCALTSSYGIQCWGSDSAGQLGDGMNIGRPYPGNVVGQSSRASLVSAGGQHTCTVNDDGWAKCWGENEHGQLGDGSSTDHNMPVHVVDFSIQTYLPTVMNK